VTLTEDLEAEQRVVLDEVITLLFRKPTGTKRIRISEYQREIDLIISPNFPTVRRVYIVDADTTTKADTTHARLYP
jgi:hypothetical protein